MPAIGKMDRQITIERRELVGDDGAGNYIYDWVPLATIAASRVDVSDTERVAYGGILSELVSRFVIRDGGPQRTVRASDRLSHDGARWDISGVKETKDGRNRFLEITAKTGG